MIEMPNDIQKKLYNILENLNELMNSGSKSNQSSSFNLKIRRTMLAGKRTKN